MSKYKFTDEEQAALKVAKINQTHSAALQHEMASLNDAWAATNQAHEQFLSGIENRLGIINTVASQGAAAFSRETPRTENLSWDELAAIAQSEYPDDLSFEDLLNTEEFRTAYAHVAEIDAEFEKKTGLQKKDFAFLAVAIALQCARQYVLDPWLKEHRRGAGNDEKGRKNNATAGWYHVDTDKILTNRVPFDVSHYGDNASIQGFLKGGDHRLMTLGHDPVLGWIFGTANIMTATVTRRDFATAHVKCINNENKMHSLADTGKVFDAVIERVSERGLDGKLALGCAIAREAIHLKSDVDTKRSLPLPGIGILSEELGNKLAQYGIDIASVGTEVTLSCFINMLISMVHRMCFDETKDDEKFYEVRTRKIILYSNLIASTSNIIAAVLTERYDLLDVGGILVTIVRLITDVRFICKVKDEFVQSKLDEHFEGIQDEIEDLYKARFAQEHTT
ncbi:MAG: hypothetical protein IIV14_09605 [Bacteroidaceae bacterium]|nr:hypothetical protein [Bacteroidaceae bacterium]